MHSESMTFESSMWAIDTFYCFQQHCNRKTENREIVPRTCVFVRSHPLVTAWDGVSVDARRSVPVTHPVFITTTYSYSTHSTLQQFCLRQKLWQRLKVFSSYATEMSCEIWYAARASHLSHNIVLSVWIGGIRHSSVYLNSPYLFLHKVWQHLDEVFSSCRHTHEIISSLSLLLFYLMVYTALVKKWTFYYSKSAIEVVWIRFRYEQFCWKYL